MTGGSRAATPLLSVPGKIPILGGHAALPDPKALSPSQFLVRVCVAECGDLAVCLVLLPLLSGCSAVWTSQHAPQCAFWLSFLRFSDSPSRGMMSAADCSCVAPLVDLPVRLHTFFPPCQILFPTILPRIGKYLARKCWENRCKVFIGGRGNGHGMDQGKAVVGVGKKHADS